MWNSSAAKDVKTKCRQSWIVFQNYVAAKEHTTGSKRRSVRQTWVKLVIDTQVMLSSLVLMHLQILSPEQQTFYLYADETTLPTKLFLELEQKKQQQEHQAKNSSSDR